MATIVYTMAPAAADYTHTKELEAFSVSFLGRDRNWRKVEIDTDSYRTAYQCDRYRSFLSGVTVLDDPRIVDLDASRQAPTNYKV